MTIPSSTQLSILSLSPLFLISSFRALLSFFLLCTHNWPEARRSVADHTWNTSDKKERKKEESIPISLPSLPGLSLVCVCLEPDVNQVCSERAEGYF